MDATEMFLIRHKRTHSRVEALTDGLTEDQIRERVHPAANPLAWLLWHMARIEDAAINLLISDGPQVLNDEWLARLNVSRRDIGPGMAMAEVLELSARIDLASLKDYWRAVGERTATVVAGLSPSDLDEVVSQERLRRVVVDDEIVEGPTGPRLQAFWKDTTRGYFLVYLPLTHNYEHIGQADLLRGLLGRPGPF